MRCVDGDESRFASVLVREPVEGEGQRLVFRIADVADQDRLVHGAAAVADPHAASVCNRSENAFRLNAR